MIKFYIGVFIGSFLSIASVVKFEQTTPGYFNIILKMMYADAATQYACIIVFIVSIQYLIFKILFDNLCKRS